MIRSFFDIWNHRFPTFGHLSLSVFFIAVIGGIPLVLPFDVHRAFDSIQLFTLTSPSASFYRSAHYWSGQLFILFTAVHVIEHLGRNSEHNLRTGVWIRISIALPVSLFLMLSGFILKADPEGELARQVLSGLLTAIPVVGDDLLNLLLSASGKPQVIYAHHLATTTVFLVVVIFEHARKIWPEILALVYGLSTTIILAIIAPPQIRLAETASVKGPWYFVGLREMLRWIPYPAVVVGIVFLAFILFMSVKWLRPVANKRMKRFLSVIFMLFILASVFNWFFRDNNWDLVI